MASTSAFFVGKRKNNSVLASFFLKRGLWLVFLEVTVITFVWTFDIYFSTIFLAVLWSLGMSMLALSGIIFLPKKVILLLSLLLIFGHNLLDTIHFDGSFLWAALHEFTTFQLGESRQLTVIYPILPWIGVMALGYYFGQFYDRDWSSQKRKKLFNWIGILAFLAFAIIRYTNVYGEVEPWEVYETNIQTVMSFFNLTKYPPSLLFLLVTLSVSFIFLANSENWKGKLV